VVGLAPQGRSEALGISAKAKESCALPAKQQSLLPSTSFSVLMCSLQAGLLMKI